MEFWPTPFMNGLKNRYIDNANMMRKKISFFKSQLFFKTELMIIANEVESVMKCSMRNTCFDAQ